MPKPRKKPGTEQVQNRIFILCEGKPGKSEYTYFSDLIKSLNLPKNRVEVKLIPTKQNTGRELVQEGIKCRGIEKDIVWVAYDKDGYEKHPETFTLARQKKINIAFSAICFEYWILLHKEYTSKIFQNCKELLGYLKKIHRLDCEKSTVNLFEQCGNNLETAMKNARELEKKQLASNPDGTPIYDMNPITTVHHLILDLRRFQNPLIGSRC